MVNEPEARQVRLIPPWWTATVVAFLSILTLLFAGLGLGFSGAMATASLALAVATGGCLVAACSTLTRRRPRRAALDTRADGTVVIDSPVLASVGLLVSWGGLLVACGIYAWVAVTDFDENESPGMTLIAVLAALGTVPDLVRLARGRLYRWRLTLAGDGITYRGYRTSVHAAWGQVRRVEIQRRGPAGVRVEMKDGSFVVPAAAFTVPSEQMLDEIRARARR
ncbi:PH domain-containing protein [Nocardioides caricicola]|uniref:PH domain-containing protein n=1 Tax=Nocardioides caricicola TaxID=634770 RepID=A0ABW0N5D1_9ACTN